MVLRLPQTIVTATRFAPVTVTSICSTRPGCSVYVDFVGVGALPEESVTVKNTDTSVELAITSADGKAVHLLKLAPLYDKINSELQRLNRLMPG